MSLTLNRTISVSSEVQSTDAINFGFGNVLYLTPYGKSNVPSIKEYLSLDEIAKDYNDYEKTYYYAKAYFYQGDNLFAFVVAFGSNMEAIDILKNAYERYKKFSIVVLDADFIDTANPQWATDVADWCEANKKLLLVCNGDSYDGVFDENEPSVLRTLSERGYRYTAGIYTDDDKAQNSATAGLLAQFKYNASSYSSMVYGRMFNWVTTDELTAEQVAILDNLRINRYVSRSGIPMFEDGEMFAKYFWMDTLYWTMWFENELLASIFNAMYSDNARIPQTDDGVSILVRGIEEVCRQGVRNGGIAGGFVSDAVAFDIRQTTGNESFDGLLHKGYLVYAEPIAEQPMSDRRTRKAPPIHVWIKGSASIQYAEVSIVFNE